MKTLKILLSSAVLLMLMQSCMFNGVTGSNNVTSESRSITVPFENIDISQGIEVYFTQIPDVSLTAEFDDNLHEILMTEVEGNTLKIYFEKNVFKRKSSKIYLTAPDLNGVSASSGSTFESENTITTDDITLESSSGADIDIRLIADKVSISTSSGSDINAQGECQYVSAEASSGSDIDASDLKSNDGEADASSGSDITLYVMNKLTADASSGADVVVLGHPKETNIDKSSGGDVSIK